MAGPPPGIGFGGGPSRGASLKVPRAAATPDGGSVSESSVGGTVLASACGTALGSGTTAAAATLAIAALKEHQARELEHEQNEFVGTVCSPNTRNDVKRWVGKIFTMTHEARMQTEQEEAKERRRRRLRTRSCGATSDAGLSGGYSAISGITGDSGTGTSATPATALLAAGGSIAAAPRGTSLGGPASAYSYRPPKSANSDESLVVHNDVDEPLGVKERVQGYLAGRLPELDAHVSARIAHRTQALKKEVDEDIADKFLRDTAERRVFNNKTNNLRWQNTRHQVLQKRLDSEMPKWIMEAIADWDAKRAMSLAKEKDVSNEDLVYDYLTKRAAHIDSGKLPTEIPVFRTMHASYSLPSMWRDRYI